MATISKSSVQFLRAAYEQGGFVRVKMDTRRKMVRSGWEVRLPSNDEASPRDLVAALRKLDIKPGEPYVKGNRKVVPIYGKEQVERFLKLVRPREKARIPRFGKNVDMRFK
jgi:hypothetical protein